jgi:hypothetical protein
VDNWHSLIGNRPNIEPLKYPTTRIELCTRTNGSICTATSVQRPFDFVKDGVKEAFIRAFKLILH